MGEIVSNKLVNVCPRCARTNLEKDELWNGMDATDPTGNTMTVTLDSEGEYYILYNYKCNDCGTIFAVKRLHEQFD